MKQIIGKFILTQDQEKKNRKLSHFMRNRLKKNYFVGYKVNFSKSL